MQVLFCEAFLFAAPTLVDAGQAKHAALPAFHSLQQQPLLLHRYHLPLGQTERAFSVEASTPTATPTPIQAPDLTDFTLVSLGLLLLFWFGNYVVPDFVFNKLFRPDMGNTSDAEKKQKVLDGLVGGIRNRIDDSSSQVASGSEALASSKEGTLRGTGFGKRVSKARKENK